jgi:threonyl-tRNA synthetase
MASIKDEKTTVQEQKLEMMRHSASHVLAEAVTSIFKDVKFGIGPAIQDGFYYDFELPRPLKPEDLPVIEDKMRELIAKGELFTCQTVTKAEAKKLFAGQPYKLQLIEEIPDETVTVYREGDFTDLCRGPHVASTRDIGKVKLLSIAGAYWKGDEHNPMLQRIYGTAFFTQKEVDDYMAKLELAAKSDHRKLGAELELFTICEEIGPGLVLWLPKGAMIRHVIETFWKEEHLKRGYQLVYTPHIARLDLWKTSGHWDFYRENMYSPIEIEDQQYIIKPMNCPGHILIYKTRKHSYRELPIRYAELGTVYRYERSGTLHGLSRVRAFTQDDSHIFCRFDQLEEEVVNVLRLAIFMIKTFGFADYQVMLSTRPEKYVGSLEVWEQATDILKRTLARENITYGVDEGGGAFYGPKIDIKLMDSLGRGWQGPTIQVDFNLPQRFDVNYTAEDGTEKQVAMVHRVVLGSMERFMASLIENYAGAFPVWLSPTQVTVIPIADRHIEYANKVADALRAGAVRVDVDARSETMGHKIREAQLQKVPFMVVLGDKEAAAGTVSVRGRSGAQPGTKSLAEFVEALKKNIAEKRLDLSL